MLMDNPFNSSVDADPVLIIANTTAAAAAAADPCTSAATAAVFTQTLLVPVFSSAVVLAEAAVIVQQQHHHHLETMQDDTDHDVDNDQNHASDNDDNSLLKILSSFRVELDDDNIPGSIENLKVLCRALLHSSAETHNDNARSPGFFSVEDEESACSPSRTWSRGGSHHHHHIDDTGELDCYEMLDLSPLDRYRVPIPSPAFAAQCCDLIQSIFGQRLAWKQGKLLDPACSCIGEWDFSGKRHVVLETLTNQAMEQLMIQEASVCISQKLLPDAASVEAWNQTYSPEKCPSPTNNSNSNEMNHQHLYHYNAQTPVKLLRTRDEYLACMVKYCMAAKRSIQISTCYLHSHDPAQRYLLLDVLPYIIQNHGVTVHVLVDLLTIEGAIIKSGFLNKTKQPVTTAHSHQQQQMLRTKIRSDDCNITMDSFLEHLPETAPAQSEASRQKIHSPVNFLQQLLQVAAQVEQHQQQQQLQGNGGGGRYQIQWWCARDAQYKYRIKNHCKCTVIDHQVAIIGGSNVAPTLEAATSDLDVLLAGPAAKDVARTMELQWNAMDRSRGPCAAEQQTPTTTTATTASSAAAAIVSKGCPASTTNNRLLQELIDDEKWADRDSRVAIIRSLPSSQGEDAILRVVLGAIADARQSVVMCMGHCNIPMPMTRAFRDATKCGVSVQVLVNSMYSCDLRGGQRDLFLSLRDLLHIAPDVEVYATALSGKDGDSTMNSQPPFLHAKYVVFDGRFTAVGSWNVWARGSFYELEHEALIHSTKIADEILKKFEEEKNATAIRLTSELCEPGAGFCPTGCAICKGFGPFFQT